MGDLKKLDELVLMDFMLHYFSEILKRNTDAKKQDFFIALSKSIHKNNFFFGVFCFVFPPGETLKELLSKYGP